MFLFLDLKSSFEFPILSVLLSLPPAPLASVHGETVAKTEECLDASATTGAATIVSSDLSPSICVGRPTGWVP